MRFWAPPYSSAPPSPRHRNLPAKAGAQRPAAFPILAPTNLQVLPKDLTGQQVHEIKRRDTRALLASMCNYCHAADPKNVGPNGRPRLNFASDEKDEKKMARIMITMTEDIKNYVKKVADMDEMPEKAPPVTCGTCHQGHEDPPVFKPAPEH